MALPEVTVTKRCGWDWNPRLQAPGCTLSCDTVLIPDLDAQHNQEPALCFHHKECFTPVVSSGRSREVSFFLVLLMRQLEFPCSCFL